MTQLPSPFWTEDSEVKNQICHSEWSQEWSHNEINFYFAEIYVEVYIGKFFFLF